MTRRAQRSNPATDLLSLLVFEMFDDVDNFLLRVVQSAATGILLGAFLSDIALTGRLAHMLGPWSNASALYSPAVGVVLFVHSAKYSNVGPAR